MSLPLLLTAALLNAVIAGACGFVLGRSRAVSGDDAPGTADVLDDLANDVADGQDLLDSSAADLAESDSAGKGGVPPTDRFRRRGRRFERRLDRSHERLKRTSPQSERSSEKFLNDLERHRDRIRAACDSAEAALRSGEIRGPELEALAAAVVELAGRNRRLSEELDEARRRLVDGEQRLSAAVRDARVDPLTKLANRRALEERLEAAQRRLDAGGDGYAVALFDVDRFKTFNDDYGHPAGDAVLAVLGKVLAETVRSYDFAARYGGEEFAVLLPGADAAAVAAVAERCRAQVAAASVMHGGRRLAFTVSGGIAVAASGRPFSEAVAVADAALYAAKQAGRNRICCD